jgi:transposase-like protein
MERARGGEPTHHLRYEKHDPAGHRSGDSRNGHSSRTVLTEDGDLDLAIPRDRAGDFEPSWFPRG